MDVKPNRRYRSPRREEQANVTRRQVLAAAGRLFASLGFASTTMDAIAREGGVAAATVYLHFPSKPAIVAALVDDIVASSDLSVEQIERVRGVVEQLSVGARIMRQLNERAWLVADILRSARRADPALEDIWETWQQRHLSAMQRAVSAVAAQSALRAGLTTGEAVDILYALTGADVYRLLVGERGWPVERYEAWLFQASCLEILGYSPSDLRRSPE